MVGVGDALPGRVYPFVEEGISGSGERRQRCGSSPAVGGRIGPRPAARSPERGWKAGVPSMGWGLLESAPTLTPCGRIGPSLASGVSHRPHRAANIFKRRPSHNLRVMRGEVGWKGGLFSFYFFFSLSLFQAEFMFV